jgi:hypothetical protein
MSYVQSKGPKLNEAYHELYICHALILKSTPMEPDYLSSGSPSSRPVRTVLVGTLLAVLVFFSLSFLTVLTHIRPLQQPRGSEAYRLSIGFPWTYYEQFWVGEGVPQSGWQSLHVVYDCFLTWLVTVGLYVIWNRTAAKKPPEIKPR